MYLRGLFIVYNQIQIQMEGVLCTVVMGLLACAVSCQGVQPTTHSWKFVIRTPIRNNRRFDVEPGTKNNVELEMIGDRGRSGNLEVTDDLMTGMNQTFTFENVPDFGELKALRVRLVGNDAWWLHSISVTNVETRREYTFWFNSLLDGDRPGTPNQVVIDLPKQEGLSPEMKVLVGIQLTGFVAALFGLLAMCIPVVFVFLRDLYQRIKRQKGREVEQDGGENEDEHNEDKDGEGMRKVHWDIPKKVTKESAETKTGIASPTGSGASSVDEGKSSDSASTIFGSCVKSGASSEDED